MKRLCGFLLFLVLPLFSYQSHIKTLYSSLDPTSLTQLMAFYELYPNTDEGKAAMDQAWSLLRQDKKPNLLPKALLPKFDIRPLIALVTRQPFDPPVRLEEHTIEAVEQLALSFANRKLKGSKAWTKEEVLALPPSEVDLCRGLLIEQFADSSNFKEDIRQYEVSLDLMALQILARLKKDASSIDKIKAINYYIFSEMQFRFPPHSLYAADIDLYTFLPSVLDSRQGVCLGVSILYLCLAQRLDLPLEIITPPGHIYIRYRKEDDTLINIETTARGINPPCSLYLGLNTRKLQKRNIKEVIALAFANQAATFWQRGEHLKAVELYEKGLPYLDNDALIEMFLGLNYLFVGREKEGKALLEKHRNLTFDYAVSEETLPPDYLDGKVDAQGLKTLFLHVDQTRKSILDKQKSLETTLKKYPKFRAGILQLAVTHLQLGKLSKARTILERYHKIDPHDPTVEYYLSIVCKERYDINNAWKYLQNAEKLTSQKDHDPAALKGLKNQLRTLSPPPIDLDFQSSG